MSKYMYNTIFKFFNIHNDIFAYNTWPHFITRISFWIKIFDV
jgi:hypothetical protein